MHQHFSLMIRTFLMPFSAVLLFAASVTVAFAQEAKQEARDRGLIQAFLEDNLSGAGRDVRISGFSGALTGRATLEEMTIADEDGVWLTLRKAVLDWDRAALFAGRLDVTELSAEELLLPRSPQTKSTPPSATASEGFALPDLGIAIKIDKLALDKVELGAALLGEEAIVSVAGSALLSEGEGKAALSLARIDDTKGELSLNGSYSNETRQLALSLTLAEEENGIAARLLGLPNRPSLALTIKGDAPIDDFSAAINLQTDGKDRLNGAVALTSVYDTDGAVTRHLLTDISGDIAPVFAPRYRPFFGKEMSVVVDATAHPDGKRTLSKLELRTRSLSLVGTGQIAADGWPEQFTLTGQISDPNGTAVTLPTGKVGTQINGAQLDMTYDRASGDAWRLGVVATGIRQEANMIETLDLVGMGKMRGNTVRGTVDGTIKSTVAGLTLSDDALSRAIGDTLELAMAFDWTDGAPLFLRDLRLDGVDYGLSGDASVQLTQEKTGILTKLDTQLIAKDLNRFAGLVGLDLQGQADLAIKGDVAPVTGELSLTFDGATKDLAIGQPEVDPFLAGDGTLSFMITRNVNGSRLDNLSVSTDRAEIAANALLDQTSGAFDVAANFRFPQTAAFDISGTANLKGKDTDTPFWQFDAKAKMPGDTTAKLSGQLKDASGRGMLKGVVDLQSARLSELSAILKQRVGGALTAQASFDATLTDMVGSVTISANSQNLAIGVPQVDTILRGAGFLQAQVRRSSDGHFSVDTATIRTPALRANATGEVLPTGQNLVAEGVLFDGAFLSPELAGPIRAKLTANRESDDWQVTSSVTGTGGMTLFADGSITPRFDRAAMSLTGKAPLGLLNERVRPRAINGLARYQLRINGPLKPASVSGTVNIDNARLTFPTLKLALGNINGDIQLGAERALISLAGDLSSGGSVRLNGPVSLRPPFRADLTAKLDQLVLQQARLYRTSANGNITIKGPMSGGALIAGQIDLGPSELRVPSLSGARYANLPGVTHLNEPAGVRRVREWAGLVATGGGKAEAEGASSYPIDLLIRAPSRIFVRGRGLDAELGGQLRLRGTSSALVPVGRFDLIRGRFDILGKRLVLDEGYLQLQGNFDAYLRFAASTRAEDVAINLALEGDASAPELRLTSSPELPQDEILSLLLFGRDVTSISPLQAVRLANAIRTLSGQGNSGITGRLRKSLALDDFSVTTDEAGNVEASAGKYLSDNIYSEVTVNGAGESEVDLNLQLNPTVTVRGRLTSEGDTGIGIYFEKNY